jgi:hypothetical protein
VTLRRWLLMVSALSTATFRAAPAGAASPDAGPGVDAAKAVGAAADEIAIVPGRTTILRIEPDVGQPWERDPEVVARVPSLRRALEMDRDQRWAEAVALYQQATSEIALAVRFASPSLWERAAFKIDLERRRSRALAQTMGSGHADEPMRVGPRVPSASLSSLPTGAMDRGRLLRLKLMAIRSATGTVPAGLVSATVGALLQALHKAPSRGARPSEAAGLPRGDDDSAEIRLLLCATRAVAGDRPGARLELAHVPLADRTDPARALALAVCQAALGYRDDALASLAVAVYRLGPSPRFLPGQTRELESSNDWDPLRADPRFERLFR